MQHAPSYIRQGKKIFLLSGNGRNYIVQKKAKIGEGADPATAIANAVTAASKLASQTISLIYSLFHGARKEEVEAMKAENSALGPLAAQFVAMFPEFGYNYFADKIGWRAGSGWTWDELWRTIGGKCGFLQGQTCKNDDYSGVNSILRTIIFNYKALIPNFAELEANLVRRAKYPFNFVGYLPEVQAKISEIMKNPQVQAALGMKPQAGTNAGTQAGTNTGTNTQKSNMLPIFIGLALVGYFLTQKK